jgi:hypothetical protein
VPEGWPYFGDEVGALEFHHPSREAALEVLLDQLERGLRQSEAKIWVAREAAGRWGPETVYEPAGDPHEYEPLSTGFWRAVFNDPEAAIDDTAHAVTAGGHRYMPIRVSPLREAALGLPADPGNHAASVQQMERHANKGGRRPKFDWHEFYREIILIAHFDGLPEREELDRQMKMFVAGWSRVPADNTLREKMAAIYERLARGR